MFNLNPTNQNELDARRGLAELLGDMMAEAAKDEKADATLLITATMHLGSKPAKLMSESGMKITPEIVIALKDLKAIVDRAVVKAEAEATAAGIDMTISVPRRNSIDGLFGK